MQIERDIFLRLLQWKDSANRKPLLLQGARQIGKTWVMREFGKRYFDNIAEFNFDADKELDALFRKTKDVSRLINELSLFSPQPIVPERTLLIFDEIQESEAALNSLKYFRENAPEYAIMAAGSLLGVAVRQKHMTVPVGQVQTMRMYPISFREFLSTSNKPLHEYIENINSTEPLPEIQLSRITEEYRRYMVCGGMPEATTSLLSNNGLENVENTLNDILQLYQLDFSKYATPVEVSRINAIWQSLPSQLSKENRKFIYSVVKTGARAREYEDALIWLETAGLVQRVFNISKPNIPLSAYRELSAFKVYAFDCGLLRRLANLAPENILSGNKLYTEFRGAIAENMVLLSLLRQKDAVPYYWNSGNQAEIDFLLEHVDEVVPVEVKSGTRISGASMASYSKKFQPKYKLRYSLNNLQYRDGLLNIPLSLADWTDKFMRLI